MHAQVQRNECSPQMQNSSSHARLPLKCRTPPRMMPTTRNSSGWKKMHAMECTIYQASQIYHKALTNATSEIMHEKVDHKSNSIAIKRISWYKHETKQKSSFSILQKYHHMSKHLAMNYSSKDKLGLKKLTQGRYILEKRSLQTPTYASQVMSKLVGTMCLLLKRDFSW